jgi:hypothetical protein
MFMKEYLRRNDIDGKLAAVFAIFKDDKHLIELVDFLIIMGMCIPGVA